MLLAAPVAVAGMALIVRSRPITDMPSLVLAVGSPYIALLAMVGLVIAVLLRHAVLAVFTVPIVAACIGVQACWYFCGDQQHVGPHLNLRVLSSNLRNGEADAAFFVHLAEESADVITVAELTPEAVRRFVHAGISRTFPHAVLKPEAGAVGIGIWSRFPLIQVPVTQRRSVATPAARLQIPGVRFDPLLSSVHVDSPVGGDVNNVAAWREAMTSEKKHLDRFAELAGPAAVIVGGDFNCTPDVRQFRDLLTDGYQDAVNQLGAGFAPTFPAGAWYPPMIAIDHVITRNSAASSIRTVEISGSDHRGLLATIQIPADPTGTSPLR